MGQTETTFRALGQDLEVPVLDGSKRRYVNLDNAASTPVLENVQRGVEDFMQWYSSIHRGAGFKSQLASWAYDEGRQRIIRFLGGEPAERVTIFGKNTTDAVNKLACRYPFKEGDILLTSLMEHHSNDLPWRQHAKLEAIQLDSDGFLDLNHLEERLKFHEGRVPLVAITGASNVSGIINPIYEIAKIVHAHGSELFVDAAQLAPHRQIRIGKKGDAEAIDYIAISAHKMYAPYGTGALIGWPEIFDQGMPEYTGGGTVKFVTHDEIIWRDPPDKDEAGSPNVPGVIALALAIQQLSKIGMQEVTDHEYKLTTRLFAGLEKFDRVKIYGTNVTDPKLRLGVVPFNVLKMPHPKTAAILGCEYGIGVRHGCFCAHPYVQDLLDCPDTEQEKFYSKILHGEPVELPGLVRVSFGIYNTEKDDDAVVEAIGEICEEKYKGNYVISSLTGGYWPENFSLDYTKFFSYE